MMSNVILAKKTWPTITPRRSMESTIRRSDHGTSICSTHHMSCHKQVIQALCEGVLELYPTDTSVQSHCPDFQSRKTYIIMLTLTIVEESQQQSSRAHNPWVRLASPQPPSKISYSMSKFTITTSYLMQLINSNNIRISNVYLLVFNSLDWNAEKGV